MTNQERTALDRYLTSPPEGFYDSESWAELAWDLVHESEVSPDDYERHDEQFWAWEEKLLRKDYTPQQAAPILSRAFRMYLKTPKTA